MYTLIFPEEKGRKKSTLREWLILRLVSVGYEAPDVMDYVFGRFPSRIRIRPYHEETSEMRGTLQKYLDANGVRIEDGPVEDV